MNEYLGSVIGSPLCDLVWCAANLTVIVYKVYDVGIYCAFVYRGYLRRMAMAFTHSKREVEIAWHLGQNLGASVLLYALWGTLHTFCTGMC